MTQRHSLTIYEPDEDPRVVELQINRSVSKGNNTSVYNEDGTVLADYQLYLEATDGEFIKVTSSNGKPEGKWNTLKSWRKSAGIVDGDRLSSSSIISDIPVSEKARDFLGTYEQNSARREKNIARSKEIRKIIQDKRLQRKLKKQRKKELKRFFSGTSSNINYSSPSIPAPSKLSSIPSHSMNSDCVLEIPSRSTSVPINSVQKKKYKKKKKKKKINGQQFNESKAVIEEQTTESEVQKVTSTSKRKRERRKAEKLKLGLRLQDLNKVSASNSTSTAKLNSPTDTTSVNPVISSRTVEPDSSVVRWKASEPALDFIPVTRSTEDSADFLSFNSPKRYGTRMSSKFLPNIKTGPQKEEFIGLSQKAFFLQC